MNKGGPGPGPPLAYQLLRARQGGAVAVATAVVAAGAVVAPPLFLGVAWDSQDAENDTSDHVHLLTQA